MKLWQKVSLAIFGVCFLMFTTTALLGDDPLMWFYPIVALVGIGITLYDGPGRKEKRRQEGEARARADREELARRKQMERRERRKRGKGK